MRVRFRFTKQGKVRWTSHRDTARMWERAFRRTDLPLAYSEGFSPRPRVAFGLALPTGCESDAEYLDVLLASRVELDGLAPRVAAALPDGVDVPVAVEVDPGAPSLQELVTSCTWRVGIGTGAGAVADALLAAPSLVTTLERKGRPVEEDVRPALVGVTAPDDGTLVIELATRPRSVRPGEVLRTVAGPGGAPVDIGVHVVRRTQQWIERDGARCTPEDDVLRSAPAATGAPHAEARAS